MTPAVPFRTIRTESARTGLGAAVALLPSTTLAPARAASETVLYSFQGAVASDGATPSGNLINVKGTLYGTTSDGGASGYGTVFKVTTAGAETVLYPFQGSVASDGAFPFGALLNVGGTLYGTTGGAGQAAMEPCSPSRRNKHASRQCGALWDNRSIPAYAGGAFRTRPTEEI